MPNHEEIVDNLLKSAEKTGAPWIKKKGPKGETLAEVDTELMETMRREMAQLEAEKDPNVYKQQANAMMEKYQEAPEVGSVIASTLISKGEEGRKAAIEVGKEAMKKEMGRYSPSGGAFLRAKHAVTGFTKTFIDETSPGMQQEVDRRVDEMAKRYQTGGVLDQVNQGTDMQAKTELASKLGKEMLAQMSSTPLSQDTVDYLKEMRSAIESDDSFAAKYRRGKPQATDEDVRLAQQEMADVVVNNNTALRSVGPAFQKHAQWGNQIWKDATAASMATFNGARKSGLRQKEGQGQTVGTEEGRAADKYMNDLRKNVHESRDMVVERQEGIKAGKKDSGLATDHLNKAELDTSRFDRAAELENGKMKTSQAKLPALEQRQKDLNKAISVEKIKAFFSRQGVAGAKAEVKDQIKEVNKEVDQSRKKLLEIGALKEEVQISAQKQEFAKKTGINPESFQATLDTPVLNKALMDFAKKEHNSENLEFMEAVKQFKADVAAGKPIEELRASAQNIKDTFVEEPDGGFDVGSLENVGKTVNLSGDVRKGLNQSFEQVMHSQPTPENFQSWGPETRQQMATMFDGANSQVSKMTERDAFARFKKSPEYQSALQEGVKPPKQSVRSSTGIDPSKTIKQDGRKLSTAGVK